MLRTQPESKPSFEQRLAQEATRVRERAKTLPQGTATSATPTATGTMLMASTRTGRSWSDRTAMLRGAADQALRTRWKFCAGRSMACSAGCPRWREEA
jgi:hypothetical protein